METEVAVRIAAYRYLSGGVAALTILGLVDRVPNWLYPFGVKSPSDVLNASEEPAPQELYDLFMGVMDDLRVHRDEREWVRKLRTTWSGPSVTR